MSFMTDAEEAALVRLIRIAQSDTGQSRLVANFLLAWWNATDCGGFDLTDLWNVDEAIDRDIQTVIKVIARERQYPEHHKTEFEELVRAWRPTLFKTNDSAA